MGSMTAAPGDAACPARVWYYVAASEATASSRSMHIRLLAWQQLCYHFGMMPRIVLDTNVFVSALLSPHGASRALLRACLRGRYQPLMGTTLFLEYEAIMAHETLFASCRLTKDEREALLDAFLSVCYWQKVYYAWRPNLPDEADNHLVELAVAGGATAIVTYNTRDFERAELHFPGLGIVRPAALVREDRDGHLDDSLA